MGSRTPRYFGDSIDITDVSQDSENLVEFLISPGRLAPLPFEAVAWLACYDNNDGNSFWPTWVICASFVGFNARQLKGQKVDELPCTVLHSVLNSSVYHRSELFGFFRLSAWIVPSSSSSGGLPSHNTFWINEVVFLSARLVHRSLTGIDKPSPYVSSSHPGQLSLAVPLWIGSEYLCKLGRKHALAPYLWSRIVNWCLAEG